jgi:hypothetical protein
MENSIIIWEGSVVIYCPYKKIITLDNFTLEPGFILYHKERQLALKLAIPKEKGSKDVVKSEFKSRKECTDALKSPLELHETVEGLYVTGFTVAKKLPTSEVDVSTIHELMLSEEDGRRYTELVEHNAARIRVCQNRLAFFRSISWLDDIFEFIPDEDETKSIVYVKDGLVMFPKCYPIKGVELEENTDQCTRDIPVSFKLNNNTVKGYMQKNKIIRATTAKVPCDKKTYVILPRLNGVLLFEGRKTKFIEAEEFVDISKAPEVFWDQVNFPHLSDVFSKVDIMHELYQEPIVNIKTKDFAIENSEILFGDVEIGFISNFVKIYRKFQRTLLILVIVLVSFLLIYIIYLCRKPIKSIGNRVIRKSRRNHVKEVYGIYTTANGPISTFSPIINTNG